MSSPNTRLLSLASHLLPSSSSPPTHPPHIHTLSPTSFLPRAAAIEPLAPAIFHVTSNSKILRRTYAEFADRARGLAYFLRKHGFRRVGILAPNTPAFLEAIFGIAASGGVNVAVNYRLKVEDVSYIFGFGEVSFFGFFLFGMGLLGWG
jgi:acyl-CoA synthetase (AMP-forming)/AMP-acid ligase II